MNYGFVPQTVSYDGDPFDVLVLGPALPGGELTIGVIVGVMFMGRRERVGLESRHIASGRQRPASLLALAGGSQENRRPRVFSRVR